MEVYYTCIDKEEVERHILFRAMDITLHKGGKVHREISIMRCGENKHGNNY